MEQLAPQHVPVYETRREQQRLWAECADRGRPVVAVRDARRGSIVRYDLQHLDRELSPEALARLRRRVRAHRSYSTAGAGSGGEAGAVGTDPRSAAEGVGGEAGPVSGELHAASEDDARRLASRLSAVVFDREGWR